MISFLQPRSNREDFLETLGLYDDDTGQAIDLVALGVTFQLEIRLSPPQSDGYIPWFTFGVDAGPIVTASLGNGITIVDTGIIQILIPELTMRSLTPQTYILGLVATAADGSVRQILFAKLPINYGGVTN